MVFSSIVFLFLFLPVTFVIYHVVPEKFRNAVLFSASIVFYAFSGIKILLLLLASLLFNFIIAILIDRNRDSARSKLFLSAGIAGNLIILGYFKYAGFLLDTISRTGIAHLPPLEIVIPVGISFYTFQELSYLIDVYRKESAQRNPVSLGTYIILFPQLIAGPIVRYSEIKKYLERRKRDREEILGGIERFAAGLSKKVLIANQLGLMLNTLDTPVGRPQSILFMWICIIAYSLQIYFDFSGYSDMAIGLGHMFGFTFPENFNYPYCAASITDFWRRWHMTLSRWFLDYVYIPLGGSRVSVSRHVFNLFTVWFLTGLWHGASWNFVVWGLVYFVLLVLEKYLIKPDDFENEALKVVYRIFTIFVVGLNFVIFRTRSLSLAAGYLMKALGFGQLPFANRFAWFFIKDNLTVLILALLFAAPVGKFISEKRDMKAVDIIWQAALVIMFIMSVSFIMNDAFNPFIYFQF